MAARIPVKAIYSGSDVTSLGEFTSSDTIAGSYLTDGSVTAAKLAADTATQAELDAVAAAALPLAGGTMTGNLVMGTNLVDGIDISARDAILTSTTTTAGAALPKTGGTMTGDLNFGDSDVIQMGAGNDLRIYHDGSNSYIDDADVGNLHIRSNDILLQKYTGETLLQATADGAVSLNHDNSVKFATTANGVTVTGGAVGTMTTDNDGSFAMSASNNFKCTPAGNFALTFTAIVAQSGNILFINSGGHTISAHANTKVDANFLATISTAGTYLLAYFSDGTNVYMTNSAIYT
jgi:hypothetical protein